ncbi:hypothetical protein TEA_002429 [Camellia sinensis var. sinensis]|uniref:Uncharacterized protein n=1 Tax=Camellia sinensis var. sinensis TaxID=542762 RepID=A0A4S4E8L3_CAMSN|nr:hypothetical protein TEA_002429 [Camellia sinensis var. sinensis]
MQMKQRQSILVEESHENDHNAGHIIFDEKVRRRSSRKPKYRNAGGQNDSIRHSIGDQTDFRADDINHYDGIDHANPRNNHNHGVRTNHRNNGVHANPNTNIERTHGFGIQANSSDDDDEDDHEPSFPQRYTSDEKEKGTAIDDGFSESSSQYPPIYDSDRSGPSCHRPFYHGQEPESVYQNWQRMEEEVPHCGGYDRQMPCVNYYEPPQNWAWTGYHDNNYGSYCYDHNMNHQSSMVRALDDPLNYEPQSHGQNQGVSWGESFAMDATDQIFGGVDPYSKVGRY